MKTTIKLHLDPEEFAPIARLAQKLRVPPEVVAYAGLNCIMQRSRDAATQQEIVDLHLVRRQGLPTWADDARSVHIYESKHDE
jgi:hypothetical protein